MAKEVEYIELVTVISGAEKIKEVDKEIDKLGKTSSSSSPKVKETGEKVKKTGEEAGKATPKVKDWGDEAKKAGQKASGSSGGYDNLIGKIKKVAGAAAIGMGLKKATSTFVSFDDEMRKVQAATGATGSSMDLLRFQAQDLGKSTRYSASESASAQFEFSKAGFGVNEILAATPGILNTATAAGIGLAEATEITSGALRMFKLGAGESNRVGDVLAKTANSTSTDVRGLGESLKYAGKDAHDFKMSLEQTSAVLGSLGNEMLKDSSAGTGLQAVFAAFKDKNKAKILVDAGINLTQDGEYRNFLDIVKDLKKKTSTMTEVETKMLVNQTFGEQGSRVINRLLGQPDEELDKLIADLENSTGYAAEMAAVMDGGLGGAFKNLTSAVEGASISFIANLEPSIMAIVNAATGAVRTIGDFFDWLNSGSYAADALSFAIIALTGGLIAYKAVMIATTAWSTIVAAGTGILAAAKMALGTAYLYATLTGGGFAGILGAINILLLPVTGTVGLVVAAVVGLGLGFIYLYKKSERFRNAIKPLIDALKSLWEWVKKFSLVSKAIEGAKELGSKVKNFFTKGSTKKSAKEQQEEIKKLVAAAGEKQGKDDPVRGTGTGENTDYLLTAGGNGKGSVKHNGYYLKGTKQGNSGAVKSINNAATGTKTTGSKNGTTYTKPEATYEDKVLNVLYQIKNAIGKTKVSIINNLNNTPIIPGKNENNLVYSQNSNNLYKTNPYKDPTVRETFETRILEALKIIGDEIKKLIPGNKIEIIIPPEVQGEELIIKMIEDLKIALINSQK